MPSTLSPPAGGARTDPARARGLRRSRAQAACPPVAIVAVPAAPAAPHLLALLTRVRDARIAADEMSPRRRYDLRAFKSAWADYGYLRRLALTSPASAHVATAMPQLVVGLARLHPGWTMTGEKFDDRDRHHSAVRRHLDDLAAAGVLTWQAGINLEGEEARTELLLLDAPAVSAEELKAARAQLAKWRRRYGPRLNTGSASGVRDVAKVAGPLSARQCEIRARNRVQQVRAARIRAAVFTANTAPPSGTAVAFGHQQNTRPCVGYAASEADHCTTSSNDNENSTACGLTTGARTRASASDDPVDTATVNGTANSRIEEEGSGCEGDLGAVAGDLGGGVLRSHEEMYADLLERAAAREAQEDDLRAAIARQATARAQELAGSDLSRSWPASRIREAWVVARYGARTCAELGGSSAVQLSRERHVQLERVLARYQRHAAAAPDGWPTAPWAAFLHAAAEWAHRWPAGTIEGLDQLTARMRARDSADDLHRLARARRRAHGRRLAADSGPLVFRALPDAGGRWPRWLKLDQAGRPIIVPDTWHGDRLVEEHIALNADWPAPPTGSTDRRLVERDVYLLAGLTPPPDLDGRSLMRARDAGHAPPSSHQPRQHVDAAVLELARLEGIPVAEVLRLAPELRADMLQAARARAARQQQHDHQQFLARLPGARPGPDLDGPRS